MVPWSIFDSRSINMVIILQIQTSKRHDISVDDKHMP